MTKLFHGSSSAIVVLLFLLASFLCLEGVHGKYGCTLKMKFERLEKEDVEWDSMTRKERRRFRKCSRGKLRRYFGILNRVAKKHGFPTIDMTGLDHSIEQCGGSEWPFKDVNPEDVMDCKPSGERQLEGKEDDESFIQAMEVGQQSDQRKLQSWGCYHCMTDCFWGCMAMGYVCADMCGWRRRGLGQSIATTPQHDGRELLTRAKLQELKAMKNQIRMELMTKCDNANLSCFNCTAPIVELNCPITDEAEDPSEEESARFLLTYEEEPSEDESE